MSLGFHRERERQESCEERDSDTGVVVILLRGIDTESEESMRKALCRGGV